MRSRIARLLRFSLRSFKADTGRRSLHRSPVLSGSSMSAITYAATVSLVSMGGGAVPDDAKGKEHHLQNDRGFVNPWDSHLTRSGPGIAWALLKSGITTDLQHDRSRLPFDRRRFSGKSHRPDTTPPTVPVHAPSFLPSRETSALRATWLGHACYYVEFPSGFRVLFDPVFEHVCGPKTVVGYIGPGRYTRVPCEIEDIPFVDAVVISHSHYDHLSYPTIMRIVEKHPNVHFFVPLKNKAWFLKCKLSGSQVTELDWWEERDISVSPGEKDSEGNDLLARVGCLPAQHSSGRNGFDKDHTLWASWSVTSGGKKVWFGGDTGYRTVPELEPSVDDYGKGQDFPHCPAFKQIGDLRGPFDLGLIPIGAYEPRYIMSPMHANPFDSVRIFKDTKCRRAMGIHWGTWVLTEEDVLEPPRKLKSALKREGLAEEGVFDVCEIGQSREFT